ncbi:phage tail assembly protein [Pseudomonas syringae]|nr:phage tail assembly protein [Pseudomonas syringae]MBD8802307.1 phage tail assembly protein [Pseudomonas syringae]MBD8812868.1 phage tail assembly protein [Pseudomonas syringae]
MSQEIEIKPLPSWLVLTDTGVIVSLKYPAEANGVTVDRLTMRAPSVKDNRIAQKLGAGSAAELEIHLFANLTEVKFTEIELLKERDYRRLQEGYFRLVEEDEL